MIHQAHGYVARLNNENTGWSVTDSRTGESVGALIQDDALRAALFRGGIGARKAFVVELCERARVNFPLVIV